MSTLTGVLFDVSGSMKENAGEEIVEKGVGEWALSIFQLLENLVKYDVQSDNHIFAVGVGAKYGKCIFDVIKTIEQFHQKSSDELHAGAKNEKPGFFGFIYKKYKQFLHQILRSTDEALDNKKYDNILEEFFQLVERNGAASTRQWATKKVICEALPEEMAGLLLKAFKSNSEFLRKFIDECLPSVCKTEPEEYLLQLMSKTVSNIKKATVEDIRKIVEKASSLLLKDVKSVFSVKKASEIFHECINSKQFNNERIKELMDIVRPILFGKTPLYEALRKMTDIFSQTKYSKYQKLLIVFSDGEPTDGDSSILSRLFRRTDILKPILENLKQLDVIVVSCLFTKCNNIQPRRLFSVNNMHNEKWNKGAHFLFRLSSTLRSQLLPRTIFLKQGWDIDITNNETKLFLQINHSKHIQDVCSLARNIVCCQDSLSDILVSVSLDIYINQSTFGFNAQIQEGDTCYANASAVVLHLSMKRIIGRDGGYPDFTDLREKIVNRHGVRGANTLNVLQEIAPEYRLHCELVDANDAMKAIAAKRPVVATFYLTDPEWHQFSMFYQRNPTGILTKAEIDLRKRDPRAPLIGHAVVLTSFNSECFRFMNSWGDNWADMGFFKVQNSKVLDFKFIDVFWTLNDLSKREIDYFKEHGAEVADKIIRSLISLQKAKYKCPICTTISLVKEFSGSLNETVCPECKGKFRSDEAGNILALNIYLTSLSK